MVAPHPGERHSVLCLPVGSTSGDLHDVIESLQMQLRKFIKNRGHFPNDNAAIKLIWLALRNSSDGKVRSTREWKLALNQFAALYGDRFTSTAH